MVRLAGIEQGKVVVDPEAIKIFQKYSENEIAFVGNYGRNASGKSYWYDKILNLSDFDGNNVINILFSTPLIAGNQVFTFGVFRTQRTILNSFWLTMQAFKQKTSFPHKRKNC